MHSIVLLSAYILFYVRLISYILYSAKLMENELPGYHEDETSQGTE